MVLITVSRITVPVKFKVTAVLTLSRGTFFQVNIHFNDLRTETFEYPSEEAALEHYLEAHPHDTEDLVFLDSTGGGPGESSDDVDDDDRIETIDIFETPMTPRGNSEEDLLKSNTSLSSSGSLQSYRGRFQEDFEFGSRLLEPEPVKQPQVEVEQEDPDSMMLRPAQEEDTSTWSSTGTSDLLF
ncbi:hypothetical protein PoB_007550600 [Plakobranchus ocellatus]|uniref:Uncharacterized protein n=1 Tax=Plakobranchus ocellatus TaxID=259542 RepID=A0AAV4DYU9_9GAST|nr:hypothetical protein PoB_007550600 [Plakobranchus ocellatus]